MLEAEIRASFHDTLRWLIGLALRLGGAVLTLRFRWRARRSQSNQKRLRRRYGIDRATPILSFGPQIEMLIANAAGKHGDARFALTSGSTARPKRILYTKRRIRETRRIFQDMYCRCCWSFSIARCSLYVFGSAADDNSLTSLLLEEKGPAFFPAAMQAPYRLERHPAMRKLETEYGKTALHLWILAIANPGVLFATNPSTLSTFLDSLADEWMTGSSLIRAFVRYPGSFSAQVQEIARRLSSRGMKRRLAQIASSNSQLPFEACVPGVGAFITWDGGYVKPFLERLSRHLPGSRYRHVPFYSMSTEVIETVTGFVGRTAAQLPLAAGVLYEFVEKGAEKKEENLLSPKDLEPGRSYAMVVSDPYGLRRYRTEDLFRCVSRVGPLPDLRFEGRQELQYSFTGEKVTADQVSAALADLRRRFPALAPAFLSCLPSAPEDEAVPHYKLIVVGDAILTGEERREIARHLDQCLGGQNLEYRSKVDSLRLGRPRIVQLRTDEFILLAAAGAGWESQFKFLPLYPRTWEALRSPRPRVVA